jgi:hypothetical protein
MADLWELICHHTYSGTPGVIYDLSDGRASHGQALGIGPSAFLSDGASPGSGAVRIGEDGERIYVPPSASWSPLGGLKAEMTVRLDSEIAGLTLELGGGPRWLISGYRFQFAALGTRLHASFSQAPDPSAMGPPSYSPSPPGPKPIGKVKGPSWGRDIISTDLHGLGPNIQVPYDRWVTLGVVNDGLTTIELSIDGTPVARTTPQWPVLPVLGVCIGNAYSVEFPMVGAIDEVKVWRLDPNWISNEFFDRPMDDATRRCWEEFLRWLQRWRRANPDCATELDQLIDALVREIAAGIAGSPAAMDSFGHVRQRYRELWSANQMGSPEMAALLDRLAAELRGEGIDPDRLDSLRRLMDSDCYRRFRSEMPSLDCDPVFAAYLSGSGGDRHGTK